MPACTFFGHRDCPDSISPALTVVLTDLIENHSVDTFYIGNHGKFDRMVFRTLKTLSLSYPDISYNVVLAYLPASIDQTADCNHSIFPEGIEKAPPRFAISYRNRWMISHADNAVTYITHSWGGAANFAGLAIRKRLTVINLADA